MIAFLDVIYVTSRPDRVGPIFNVLRRELWAHAHIADPFGENPNLEPSRGQTSWLRRVDHGRTKGRPRCVVWKGDHTLPSDQGLIVLGTPLGSAEFVQRELASLSAKHQSLLDRIPQCSCSALLPGRIASSACFTQTSRACSLHNTTVPSGDVWNNCCTQPCQTGRGLWPPYHWQWVGWVWQKSLILVKLGRRLAHDSPTSPFGGGIHVGDVEQ